MDTNQQFERLKRKYAGLFKSMDENGLSVLQAHAQHENLVVSAAAPSLEAKNKVIREAETIDPNWIQDLVLDIRTEAEQQPPEQAGQSVVNTTQDSSQGNRPPHR